MESTSHRSALAHSEDSIETRKRSIRACDQCRKTKSKCKRKGDDISCRTCIISGSTCTFFGPSFKRGPPKGYIHAIEQRLLQVESVLGVITGSSDERAKGVINDLRRDHHAKGIIDRVDGGASSSMSRASRTNDVADETSSGLTGIIKPLDFAKYHNKIGRESRSNREIVSTDYDDGFDPTPEWQDDLSAQLTRVNDSGPIPMNDSSPASSSGGSETPPAMASVLSTDNMQGQENELDDMENTLAGPVRGFMQLAVDENNKIRFHGEASSMPLLDRIVGGLNSTGGGNDWHPPIKRRLSDVHSNRDNVAPETVAVEMPSLEHQDLLVELYFTYVHPILPVVHRQTFMSEYQASKSHETTFYMGMSTPEPEPFSPDRREGFQLLLMAMFTVACRYKDAEQQMSSEGRVWDDGRDYFAFLEHILNATHHRSSITTCQALIILAYREGGVGSLERSWMFLGMAIRMAQDLGLHRSTDLWQRTGVDIFTPSQKQERKQVWWACNIIDKYMSVNLGRPVTISDHDFDTELPLDDPSDEYGLWIPHPPVPEKSTSQPAASHTHSCFRAASSLAVIIGSIVEKIYAVRGGNGSKLNKYLRDLEARLEKWHLALPEYLRYSTSSDNLVPPPHILCINIQYWCAVLLLHRKFIPDTRASQSDNPNEGSLSSDGNASLMSLDVCQSAANNILSIITAHSVNFSLRRGAAYLPAYLFSSGVIHCVTLSLQRSHFQAQFGLQQILSALREIEAAWPGATRPWELLNIARMRLVESGTPLIRGPSYVRNAFGSHDQQRFGRDELTRTFPVPQTSWTAQSPAQHQASNLLMVHMLGLEMQPSVNFDIRTHDAWSPTEPHVPPTSTFPVSVTSVSDSMSGPMSHLSSTASMAVSPNFPNLNSTFSSDFAQNSSSSVTPPATTSAVTHFASPATPALPRYDQWFAETDDSDVIFEEYRQWS